MKSVYNFIFWLTGAHFCKLLKNNCCKYTTLLYRDRKKLSETNIPWLCRGIFVFQAARREMSTVTDRELSAR